MQKYQFWKNSYTQNTFFVFIETTGNTFFLQKKVFFHAEHVTLKKGVFYVCWSFWRLHFLQKKNPSL